MITTILALMTPRNWMIAGALVLIAFSGIQTARLGSAKHDLAAARSALINPATKKTWKAEALAAQADLSTCRDNGEKLKGAIKAQNSALQAQADQSVRSIAESQKAAQSARAVAASARHEAERILSEHLTGATACERAEDARRKFVESL